MEVTEAAAAAAAPGAGDDAEEEEEPEPCPLEDMGVILSGGVNPLELRQAQKHFGQGMRSVRLGRLMVVNRLVDWLVG